MKKKYRVLKILVVAVILLFLLNFSVNRFNHSPLKNINVNIIQGKTPVYFVNEKNVEEVVLKNNPQKKLGKIDIPKLEEQIKKIPMVDSVNVYLDLNGKINVDIVQVMPIFRLKRGNKDFYIDGLEREFPIVKTYSYPCILVSGNVLLDEYKQVLNLIDKINEDAFFKKFFVGIEKENRNNYYLLTSDGHYIVELGDLDDLDFKLRGFKTFTEKYLVYQSPEKYKKISVKYQNQIVATLNPNFKENDSLISSEMKTIQENVLLKKPSPQSTQISVSSQPKEIISPQKEVKKIEDHSLGQNKKSEKQNTEKKNKVVPEIKKNQENKKKNIPSGNLVKKTQRIV